MSADVANRPLLTIRQVAERLNVNVRTVERMIERDELPSLQLGGPRTAIRIDPVELDGWLYGERPSTGTDDAA